MLKSYLVPDYSFVDAPTGDANMFCPMCFYCCNSETEPINGFKYKYCTYCGIVFQPCCLVISRCSTDNTYTAKLIIEYLDNGTQVQNSMPRFKSLEEANQMLPKLEPLFSCHKCSKKRFLSTND